MWFQRPGWGNGKAIAVLFARQGASIYGVGRSLDAARETTGLIAAEAASALTACRERFGRIDILVNNVGRSKPGDPATMDEAVWDEQLDVKSADLTCKAVLPPMEEQGDGAIVNVSRWQGCAILASRRSPIPPARPPSSR